MFYSLSKFSDDFKRFVLEDKMSFLQFRAKGGLAINWHCLPSFCYRSYQIHFMIKIAKIIAKPTGGPYYLCWLDFWHKHY